MCSILTSLDVSKIQEYQQNRYPCLFVDFVSKVIPGESADGYKNFSYNEWYFPSHFADEPNVPGFIQIEALVQVFLMTFLTLPGNKGKKTAFLSIDGATFRKKIVPGDRLDIHAQLTSYKRGIARGTSIGTVNGTLACKAEFTIVIPDVLRSYNPKMANNN